MVLKIEEGDDEEGNIVRNKLELDVLIGREALLLFLCIEKKGKWRAKVSILYPIFFSLSSTVCLLSL